MAVQFSETRPYFAKTLALKNLLGERAFSDFKRLMDPCCGIGLDKICTSPCGGGGTPSLPLNSIQYNNAGAFFGDALFTRDPITNNTIISQNFGGNELGAFQLDGSNVDLGYTNTITGEGAGMNFNNSSGVEAQLGYTDGANQYNNLVFNTNSTSLTWDADTTDTIETKLEQSQDILGLGAFSGSALTWQDTGTEIVGFVGAVDGTAGGRTPGDALITTINTATGDQAGVITYNDPIEGLSVGAYAQNGNIVANLSLSSIDGIFNYKTQGGVGQEAIVSVTPTETYMSFILDSLSPTYKASLGNGVFLVNDLTNSINYFIIDIINSSMTINPTLVPTYADDAAAGVGGLTSGQLYKTTSGGSTFLKIVP